MRMLLFTALICASTAIAAAGELHWIAPFPSRDVPATNFLYGYTWANTTGQVMYVDRYQVFTYGGNWGYLMRQSDSAILSYWVRGQDEPQPSPETFRPDYFVINPGDGLTLRIACTGYDGGTAAHVGVYLWYTETP